MHKEVQQLQHITISQHSTAQHEPWRADSVGSTIDRARHAGAAAPESDPHMYTCTCTTHHSTTQHNTAQHSRTQHSTVHKNNTAYEQPTHHITPHAQQHTAQLFHPSTAHAISIHRRNVTNKHWNCKRQQRTVTYRMLPLCMAKAQISPLFSGGSEHDSTRGSSMCPRKSHQTHHILASI